LGFVAVRYVELNLRFQKLQILFCKVVPRKSQASSGSHTLDADPSSQDFYSSIQGTQKVLSAPSVWKTRTCRMRLCRSKHYNSTITEHTEI